MTEPQDGSKSPEEQVFDAEMAPETGGASQQDAERTSADDLDSEAAGLSSGEIERLEGRVAELQGDLKRAQADYVNSRRRLEVQRGEALDAGVSSVLSDLVPVLDEIELARQHGDLGEGSGLGSTAAKLEEVLEKKGLSRYGAVGDVFDPEIHEALLHSVSDEVTVNTVQQVAQPGYLMNGRVLRPARVLVQGPQG